MRNYFKALGLLVVGLPLATAVVLVPFIPMMVTHNVNWVVLPLGISVLGLAWIIAQDEL